MKSPSLLEVVLGSLLFLSAAQAQSAGTATLAWTDSVSTNVVSQTVSYGIATGVYTNNITLSATNTQFQVTNLVQGITYFFAVKCSDTHGLSSAYSGEATYLVPFSPPAPPTSLRIIGP